jgi:TPR repeat protein
MRKFKKKRSKFLTKALSGDALAQFCVGKTFLPNVFMQNDPSRACRNEDETLSWFSKAAQKGLLDAMYFKALGLYSKDAEQSIALFRQAAGAGHTLSMSFLGGALAEGYGIPKNEIQALFWLNIAASRKSDMRNAIVIQRDNVEQRLSREEVSVAQKLSTSWKPKTKQGKLVFQSQEVDCE